MPGVALLAAAFAPALFLFALGSLKWPIVRRRLVGVLGISANPLLQFFDAPLQLVQRLGQLENALIRHLDIGAHRLWCLEPIGRGKGSLDFNSRKRSTAIAKNLDFFTIIPIGYNILILCLISAGYDRLRDPVNEYYFYRLEF